MMEWIIGGSLLGAILVALGIYLGRRARLRRRQAWRRFAHKRGYTFDPDAEAIRGEVDGVGFEIRAGTEVDENGETISTTHVVVERELDLSALDSDRTPVDRGEGSEWKRLGRTRRSRALEAEIAQIEQLLS